MGAERLTVRGRRARLIGVALLVVGPMLIAATIAWRAGIILPRF